MIEIRGYYHEDTGGERPPMVLRCKVDGLKKDIALKRLGQIVEATMVEIDPETDDNEQSELTFENGQRVTQES